MKKSNKFIIILIIFLLLIGIFIIKILPNKNEKYLQIVESNNCNYSPDLYSEFNDIKIYTYCLDSIKIKNKELKEYLQDNNSVIDELTSKLTYNTTLYDGGTTIYKDTKNISNNGISLIKCKTLDGVNDIYIGNKDMNFKSNFCKKDNKTFVKTYSILSVNEYTEDQYEDNIPVSYANSYKVLLVDTSGVLSEVIINNLFTDLKIGSTYDFEFMGDENYNVQDMFLKNTIVEIRKK